jgi:hypothetical protein
MKGVPKMLLVSVALLAWAFSLASAFDPSPLQDFCVAINDTSSDHAGIYHHSFDLLLCPSFMLAWTLILNIYI